jgi:hypothetical protein
VRVIVMRGPGGNIVDAPGEIVRAVAELGTIEPGSALPAVGVGREFFGDFAGDFGVREACEEVETEADEIVFHPAGSTGPLVVVVAVVDFATAVPKVVTTTGVCAPTPLGKTGHSVWLPDSLEAAVVVKTEPVLGG